MLKNKAGTGIDLATLYGNRCQAVGLEPVLDHIPGHCFPGEDPLEKWGIKVPNPWPPPRPAANPGPRLQPPAQPGPARRGAAGPSIEMGIEEMGLIVTFSRSKE